MTARVFVPLVGASGTAEQMFEALAGDVAPELHPANLTPQISELFDFGLYRVGQTVREAVTRFIDDRRAKVWLGRRNARVAPWYLRISDLQIGRLSEENARSAGLGLALAAILHAFGRDAGTVFATGEVILPAAPGSPTVAIGPVDGIRGKLMLIGDAIVQHRAALQGGRIVLVLPATTVDGRAMASAEGNILGRLQAEADTAGAKLDIVFAETLDSLEAKLGAFEMEEILTPKRAGWLAAAIAAVLAVAGGWLALAKAPIRLAWAPVAMAGSGIAGADADPMPQRAHYDSTSDKLQLLPRCYDGQRQPLVVGGETLLLRATMHDGLPFASHVRAPRMFIASVSRAADPIILDANLFRQVGSQKTTEDGLDVVTAIPIEPVEDEVRLFVVATRDPNVQVSQLVEDLRKRLAGLTGAAVLTTTASFLEDRLGAAIDYQFKVTNDAHLCSS